MSRGANLSMLGLYNWDPTIFDTMQLPSGIDKSVLVGNLLAETAELEVLYSDPDFMKVLIGTWSRKQIDVWTKLYQTTVFDYNPIENYNRMEEGTTSGTDSTTHSGTDRRQHDITTGGEDSSTGSATQLHKIAGYDSVPSGEDNGLVLQSEDQTDSENTVEYGRTEGHTESVTHGEKIRQESGGRHTLHAHGNIGVMSTQEMIEAERQVDLFNIYDTIIEDFKNRFCILVY